MGTKYSLASRITIPNGADLNDYLVPGSYASQGGSYTIANNPYNNIGAFGLDVEYCLGDSYYIKQTIKPYMSSLRFYVRYWSPNIWSHWSSFVQTSDLGHVDVTMNVTAGYTKISKIEGLNYIPVILRASIQYEGLSVCGSYPDNSWVAVSNTEQNITIRFFKYPV